MQINHIGISGGKDSTALLLWAIHESGYDPATVQATFCDTGNEADETYEYVRMLSDRVHPIETIKPERDFWELARHKKRFPSAMARFCTQELKMKPTFLHVTQLIEEGNEVLLHSGVRAAESDDRAKLDEYEPVNFDSYFPAPVRRPLLRWTIEDVWAIHERYGIPRNPLYAMRCQRVGCLPCIMSRKKEIANIAQRWPERIDFIRTQEGSVRNGCGYSSMFARDKVPDRYRTKTITSAEKKPKKEANIVRLVDVDERNAIPGRQMQVATIDDVAAWAVNSPDLYEADFDFYAELPPACDSRYGACE